MAWNFLFCDFFFFLNAFGEWVMFSEFCVAVNVFSVPKLSQEKIDWEATWDRKQTIGPLLFSFSA